MDQNSVAGAASPEPRYVISGEGREEFTRTDLRNRIREGTLTPATEIAKAGSENWIAAAQFPELARYFSLAGKAMAADPGLIVGVSQEARVTRTGESVASRLIPGLAYPLTAVGISLVVVLGVAQQMPVVSVLAGLFASLYSLVIIRASARGEKTLPPLSQIGNPVEALLLVVKIIVVTIASAWPIVLAIGSIFILPLMARSIILLAFAVTVLYYPACLATLAVWNSVKFALTPSQIFSFIRILGTDHFLAVMAWFGSFALSFAVFLLAAGFKAAALPLTILASSIMIWGGFYSAHILGWAVARHRHELE